jgi:hypothetical protein
MCCVGVQRSFSRWAQMRGGGRRRRCCWGSQSQMGMEGCTAYSAAAGLLQSVAEWLLLPAAATAAAASSPSSSSSTGPAGASSSSSSRGLTVSSEFRQRLADLICDFDKRGRQLQTANAQEGGGAAVSTALHTVQLVRFMDQAGGLLCAALPGSCSCNNPGCKNLGTFSEAFALVRGKGCMCGGCKAGGLAQGVHASTDGQQHSSAAADGGTAAARCVFLEQVFCDRAPCPGFMFAAGVRLDVSSWCEQTLANSLTSAARRAW